MTKEDFEKRLIDGVLLFDGAFGTMLYTHGIYINRCYDELNLSMPDLIKRIHTEYLAAGADCLETNTFGANRFKLTGHGFKEKTAEINYMGARLAREAAGPGILVAGSIGPLGIAIEPWGPTSREEARQAFLEQATALRDGGVDLFVLETFSNLEEIHQAILAVQAVCDLPIVAAMTVDVDGNLSFGPSVEKFAPLLDDWGATAIGLNCSTGPHDMLQAVERLLAITAKPILAMPNAGIPRMVEGRNIYLASPEYMAEYARRFIQAGVKLVGGCCGTTPQHIKAMRNAIRSIIPHTRPTVVIPGKEDNPGVETIPLAQKSQLGKKLAEKTFVTSVEIVPPRGCDPGKVLESVRRLKESRIDAVNIPDGPRALTRMSAQHFGFLIEKEVGIETILHYTCRDRNLLGMMSDMLGLYAVGIKNLLIVTGDPPKMGDAPDATAVFDVDSIGLTNMVCSLNHGLDLGGKSIGKPTGYCIGVGLNPAAPEIDRELNRFEWKVKAGAEFAMTQPVFDIGQLFKCLDRLEHVRIPIIAGIWPLVSLRNAEFMNNEVPGISIPPEIIERMRAAESRGKSLEEGIAIAREMVIKVKDRVQGVQVSAPFGRVQYALDVLSVLEDEIKTH